MSNQNFSTGMEILHSDLNDLQSRGQRFLFDKIIYELIGRKSDGFFQGGAKVTYKDADEVRIKAGLGFMTVAGVDDKTPSKQPIYFPADMDVQLTAAHATLPRIDIICVKSLLDDMEEELRRYKEEFVDTIFTETFVISKEWQNDVSVVAGVANAVPVVPATPAGYIKLAEVYVTAVTGVANQAAITDKRTLLPFISQPVYGGYDAVVGSSSFCTHATLNEVMADQNVALLKNILVLDHPALTASQVISQGNLRIEFRRGAKIIAGAYTGTGISINADSVELLGAKFENMTIGVQVEATKKNNIVNRCRFLACTSDIVDNGINSELSSNLTEV